MATKEITIARAGGWYGIFRTMRVLIDDQERGTLKRNQSMTVTIPETGSVLKGAMDWATTAPFDLTPVPDGGTVTMTGKLTGNELGDLAAAHMPFDFKIS